jgi:hypothetical protein
MAVQVLLLLYQELSPPMQAEAEAALKIPVLVAVVLGVVEVAALVLAAVL